MDKVEIRVRRGAGIGAFLTATLALIVFSIGSYFLIQARDRSGALAPWWLLLPTVLICAFYVALSVVAVRLTLRELTGAPRATLDDRGIELRGVGLIEWQDVRDVEIVPRRRGVARLRIDLDRWEKYASHQPGWVRRLERWFPSRDAVVLSLDGTGADPTATSNLIRDWAARHRRPAA